jgi:hypothetical protein
VLIFTTSARELIGRAFDAHGDAIERGIWSSWSSEHQDVRYSPTNSWDDGKPFDRDFARAAASVLGRLFNSLFRETRKPLFEDELEDLDYQLARIRSVIHSLEQSQFLELLPVRRARAPGRPSSR